MSFVMFWRLVPRLSHTSEFVAIVCVVIVGMSLKIVVSIIGTEYVSENIPRRRNDEKDAITTKLRMLRN